LTVDLQRQVVVRPSGEAIAFELDDTRRHALLEGLDEIGQTLGHAAAIDHYETSRRAAQPWLPAITVG
jgi:3-isopropylmalate/(R)-2-methylmalate dehydratase small subunit